MNYEAIKQKAFSIDDIELTIDHYIFHAKHTIEDNGEIEEWFWIVEQLHTAKAKSIKYGMQDQVKIINDFFDYLVTYLSAHKQVDMSINEILGLFYP